MADNRFTRRDALKVMAAGAAAGAVSPLFPARADLRPNVIFILTDDHRHDAFGFMDKPWLKTPNMDRLATEGVHFNRSFVTTSLCSPSRASFLTGKYASCHGVQNNYTPWPDRNVTFLELLKANGYDTGFIGKWHMPGQGIPDLVAQGKVDHMVSFSYMGGQGVYNDCPLIVDGIKTKQDGYITDVLTDYAMDFLDRKRSGPFCLYLAHKAVHYEFIPPPRYKGKLDGVELHPMEENVRNYPMGLVHVPQRKNFERNQQGYYEALMGVDDSVGSVLDWLDQKGQAENTMVVYQGENGYYWGEHGLIDKRYAYEEGLLVPHLMRFPRLVPDGGREIDDLVLNVDLFPTILQAAGMERPGDIQGKSYLDLAAGREKEWRRSFFYEYFKDPGFPHPPIKAVRTRDWKLITYPGSEKRFPEEMYDLVRDPGERNDLAFDPEYADRKEGLRAEMESLEKEIGCGA